jgi:hypothetical protein
MTQIVPGSVSQRLSNFDGVGISHERDRVERHAILRSAMKSPTIHGGVDRTWKHVSIVVCTSAVRSCFTMI